MEKLSSFYAPTIDHVTKNARDPVLRDGMVKMLTAMRTAEQPVVSVQVTEEGLPDGGAKAAREDWVRDEFAKGVNEVFGQIQPAVTAPAGVEFREPPGR